MIKTLLNIAPNLLIHLTFRGDLVLTVAPSLLWWWWPTLEISSGHSDEREIDNHNQGLEASIFSQLFRFS
jgi:hypothetical protein